MRWHASMRSLALSTTLLLGPAACEVPPPKTAARSTPSPIESHVERATEVPESRAAKPIVERPAIDPPRVESDIPPFVPSSGFVPYGLLGPLPDAPRPDPPPRRRRRSPAIPVDLPPERGLPPSLQASDIKRAVAKVQPLVERCLRAHPPTSTSRKRIQIKAKIAGATGRLLSAEVMPPFADDKLDRCVARAMKRAQFPRFARSSLGFVYPFRIRGR